MTLGWLIAAIFGQLMLGGLLFMLVVVSACSMDGIDKLAGVHSRILNLAIWVLPGSCALSTGMLVYWHDHGGGAWSWWWQAAPVLAGTAYLIYAWRLKQRIKVLDTLAQGATSAVPQGEFE